jgi:L-ascorbate metabolism protein UlaG (beta-lactamase superfamily)
VEISWLGHSCTRVRTKQATLVMDPYQREGNLDMGRPNADIVTVSHDDPRHSYVAGVRGQPLVISAPGEYEVQGVLIMGVPTSARGTDPAARNTAYLIEAEGLHVAQLGAIGAPPTAEEVELLSNADILLLPIGEDGLDPDAAARTVRALEPRITIPVGYNAAAAGQDPRLRAFLSAVGIQPEEPVARFSIQGHGANGAQRVVLLEPRT